MSMPPDSTSSTDGASWRDLFGREYLPRLATTALALWLHASNSMLTATTMPSAIDEIGGLELIGWTFALYLAGSITAASSISLLVARTGPRRTMVYAAQIERIAFWLFAGFVPSAAIGNLMAWRFVSPAVARDADQAASR